MGYRKPNVTHCPQKPITYWDYKPGEVGLDGTVVRNGVRDAHMRLKESGQKGLAPKFPK